MKLLAVYLELPWSLGFPTFCFWKITDQKADILHIWNIHVNIPCKPGTLRWWLGIIWPFQGVDHEKIGKHGWAHWALGIYICIYPTFRQQNPWNMDFFLTSKYKWNKYFTPKGLKDSREQNTPMGRLFGGEHPQRPKVFSEGFLRWGRWSHFSQDFFFKWFLFGVFFQRGPKSAPHTALRMDVPGTEVRIKGDRSSRLFHPNISHLWVGEITH